MRWPKWEMRARHFDKKFRQSDEFSQNLPAKNVQSFAKILKKFFENKKDDCKKNTDQRTPDCDMLKNNSMVSYDYSLQRCVLEDRDADGSWTMQWGIEDATASHSQAETTRLPEELLKTEVIKSYDEAREVNELNVQDVKLCFRFQKDEAGRTTADIVKEFFKPRPKYSDTLWARCWWNGPRSPPTSMACWMVKRCPLECIPSDFCSKGINFAYLQFTASHACVFRLLYSELTSSKCCKYRSAF
eukprot:s3133_g2.t1